MRRIAFLLKTKEDVEIINQLLKLITLHPDSPKEIYKESYLVKDSYIRIIEKELDVYKIYRGELA